MWRYTVVFYFDTYISQKQHVLSQNNYPFTSSNINLFLGEVFWNIPTKMGLTVGNDETPGVGDKIEELRTIWKNNMTMMITFKVNVTAS